MIKKMEFSNPILYILIVTQREFHFWIEWSYKTQFLLLVLYSRVAHWICWFGIMGSVDVTGDESIFFFSTPLTLSLLVPSIMDDESRAFNWNWFCQLVFFLVIVSRKNGNLGKCFRTICMKKKISHLAPPWLL